MRVFELRSTLICRVHTPQEMCGVLTFAATLTVGCHSVYVNRALLSHRIFVYIYVLLATLIQSRPTLKRGSTCNVCYVGCSNVLAVEVTQGLTQTKAKACGVSKQTKKRILYYFQVVQRISHYCAPSPTSIAMCQHLSYLHPQHHAKTQPHQDLPR